MTCPRPSAIPQSPFRPWFWTSRRRHCCLRDRWPCGRHRHGLQELLGNFKPSSRRRRPQCRQPRVQLAAERQRCGVGPLRTGPKCCGWQRSADPADPEQWHHLRQGFYGVTYFEISVVASGADAGQVTFTLKGNGNFWHEDKSNPDDPAILNLALVICDWSRRSPMAMATMRAPISTSARECSASRDDGPVANTFPAGRQSTPPATCGTTSRSGPTAVVPVEIDGRARPIPGTWVLTPYRG